MAQAGAKVRRARTFGPKGRRGRICVPQTRFFHDVGGTPQTAKKCSKSQYLVLVLRADWRPDFLDFRGAPPLQAALRCGRSPKVRGLVHNLGPNPQTFAPQPRGRVPEPRGRPPKRRDFAHVGGTPQADQKVLQTAKLKLKTVIQIAGINFLGFGGPPWVSFFYGVKGIWG